MRRARLLFNPRAGRSSNAARVERVREILAREFAVDLLPTSGPAECREIARAAVDDRVDALFVLGGDGTLRVVASALAGSEVAVGVLPGGTTNVVALALGLPADAAAAARRLLAAEPQPMDLGRCGDEPFLMQVSGGLDATVMANAPLRWKRRIGKGAIALAGARELWRYRFPEITLGIDGREERVTGFVVANLSRYAGRFEIVPEARTDDRQLEILLFRGRRRRDALGFALDLARVRHTSRADVEVRRVDEVRLLAPHGMPLQYDGDPFVPRLPIAIGLAAERLLVLTPRG